METTKLNIETQIHLDFDRYINYAKIYWKFEGTLLHPGIENKVQLKIWGRETLSDLNRFS